MTAFPPRFFVTPEQIDAQVAAFYAAVRVHPVLGPVFAGHVTDWPAHEAKIGRFWRNAILHERSYDGNPFAIHRRAGDGLFVLGNALRGFRDQFLRHGDRPAVAAQQQTVAFQRGEILANRNFRGFEALGQFIHTAFALLVEQGEDRGYHIHAAFFFNGAEVSADIYRAQRIGELWERITRGQGCYNNCNLDKDKYQDRLGIGLIHRRELNARANVHHAMRYLVKNDQHLRVKPEGARCLRRGQAKKVGERRGSDASRG